MNLTFYTCVYNTVLLQLLKYHLVTKILDTNISGLTVRCANPIDQNKLLHIVSSVVFLIWKHQLTKTMTPKMFKNSKYSTNVKMLSLKEVMN